MNNDPISIVYLSFKIEIFLIAIIIFLASVSYYKNKVSNKTTNWLLLSTLSCLFFAVVILIPFVASQDGRLVKSALLGNSRAQFEVGKRCNNKKYAKYWLCKSIENGNTLAMIEVAKLDYFRSEGFNEVDNIIIKSFDKASKSGYSEAIYFNALLQPSEESHEINTVEMLKLASKMGNIHATRELWKYFLKKPSNSENKNNMLYYLKLATQAKDPLSIIQYLGNYRDDDAIFQNKIQQEEALAYANLEMRRRFFNDNEMGYSFYIAISYMHGVGCERDLVEAYKWFCIYFQTTKRVSSIAKKENEILGYMLTQNQKHEGQQRALYALVGNCKFYNTFVY